MPHFRVDDGLDSHPKAERAGDEALGMWTRAGSWCMRYLTDGFVPEWWVKKQPNGTRKAHKLVAVQLWHRAERDGETGYQFHEFVGPGRQDSRAKIEADRELARKRKEKSRRESHRDDHRDGQRESRVESRRSPGYTQPNPTQQKISSGYLTDDRYEPNAREAVVDEPAHVETTGRRTRRQPTSASLTVVRQVLGNAGYPRGTLERLAVQVGDLARDGHADSLIRESLTEWDRRSDCDRAEFLPTVLGDLVKRSRAAPGATGRAPASKVRQFAELAAQERARELAQLENPAHYEELE